MPDLIGEDSRVALARLRNLGVSGDITLTTARCEPYTVLETVPAAGEPINPNVDPLLFVCDPLLMPNLVDLTEDEALAVLASLGITAPEIVYTPDRRFPDKTVWASEPPPQQPIPAEPMLVTLFVIDHASSGGGRSPVVPTPTGQPDPNPDPDPGPNPDPDPEPEPEPEPEPDPDPYPSP
jgi:beta-lactam-binding protein with PASTA domain